MRIISIISLIAAFALATVVCVCADVITSNSGVADTTSLQTRRLRGEVHVVRIRRPVDGSSISSDDESTSAEAPTAVGGDPSPPIRKRKHIPEDVEYASGILVNLKNAGNGADAASSPGTRPNRQKQKGQLNLNPNNNDAEETADVPSASRKTFKKSTEKERQDKELYLRQRMKTEGSLPSGTVNEAVENVGRHQNTFSLIYKQLKPKSANEHVITDQERQDIVLFLRQRMNPEGSLPTGTIAEAARHFDRHRSIIDRIYMKIKPKSANERSITDEERQDIVLFLRQRMNSEGSLHYGTINDAIKHFGENRRTIERIYNEVKPKSVNERGITDQEQQDIILFLRQRMNAKGSLPHGTINDAAEHFNRDRHTIQKILKELKPKFAYERVITDQERQDIMLFLRQRMKEDGSLPHGTISEAADHFSRVRHTIQKISKELKPKFAYEREIADQERQDIMHFLRQRMNAKGLLQYGAILEAAQHFGRHKNTISRIYKKMIPNYAIERGALIDEMTIVPT